MKRFPFKVRTVASLETALDNHLDHTIIHDRRYQSRGFPRQQRPSLASFAVRISKGDHRLHHGRGCSGVFPYPLITAQGRLHCTQRQSHRIAGSSYPVASAPAGSYPNMSPRRMGQRPHAVADRPSSLTPSTNPKLGVSSLHQKLHRYAL